VARLGRQQRRALQERGRRGQAATGLRPPGRPLQLHGDVLVRNPRGEHQAHRVAGQPPGRKPERLRRGAVQPLLVIHHADQRTLPGRLGQQAQHGQAHQKPVRRWTGAEAERGPQRLTLRNRERSRMIEHRRTQLMQPREGQLHLRLHARRARHPAARRPPGQVVKQHRLAHARLTAHDQGLARTGSHTVDEAVKHAAFGTPVRQP
jgi:hypothetical protein